MKPSDEIFQLIRSMSEKEKRFFRKKYTSFISDEDINYLKLFDEISRQAASSHDYDEKKIKEGKYSGKFIKNLPFHKNYLYNTILDTLSLIHKDSKEIFTLKNLTIKAEILSDKMLYEQSLKLLRRAQTTASEKDLFNSQFEILNSQRIIGKYTGNAEEYSSAAGLIFEEQYGILELQKNILDYYVLNDRVSMHARKLGSGLVRRKEDFREFEKIFDNPLLRNIENAKTFICRYIFYNLNLQLQLTKKNFEEAYKCAKSAVDLWENNLNKITGKIDSYIFSLNNLLNCEIRSRRFDDCDLTAAKMKNVEKIFPELISESNKVFIFYSISVLMLSKYMATADADNLRSIENEIRKDIKLYEDKLSVYQRIILYFFLSSSNSIQDEFENCIYWNGKIFNLGKTDLSEDYQCYARIIQLISYYELGYIDSMEYAMKSAYHFLSKIKRVYKYENIIKKYLRKSFRIKTDKELTEMFKDMRNELEDIFHDDFEKNAFDAFNILPWLESKIRKVPTIQVIKENISN